jgi:chemotaxis protein histidine kinase CheA
MSTMTEPTPPRDLDQLFRSKLAEMVAELGVLAERLDQPSQVHESAENARYIAHRLHGVGAMYGYPLVGRVGAALEEVMLPVRDGCLIATDEVIGLVRDGARLLERLGRSKDPENGAAEAAAEYTWACQKALHASDPPEGEADD